MHSIIIISGTRIMFLPFYLCKYFLFIVYLQLFTNTSICCLISRYIVRKSIKSAKDIVRFPFQQDATILYLLHTVYRGRENLPLLTVHYVSLFSSPFFFFLFINSSIFTNIVFLHVLPLTFNSYSQNKMKMRNSLKLLALP